MGSSQVLNRRDSNLVYPYRDTLHVSQQIAQRVHITGLHRWGAMREPFPRRDGKYLFFKQLPHTIPRRKYEPSMGDAH